MDFTLRRTFCSSWASFRHPFSSCSRSSLSGVRWVGSYQPLRRYVRLQLRKTASRRSISQARPEHVTPGNMIDQTSGWAWQTVLGLFPVLDDSGGVQVSGRLAWEGIVN